LATKRTVTTAIGLTGVFAFANTLGSGWSLGAFVGHYGWNAGLPKLTSMAAIGVLLFALGPGRPQPTVTRLKRAIRRR
jgi:sugar phosphate permease